MTFLVKELRDALVEAGAIYEKADAAAAAVVAVEHAATRQDITSLKSDIAELKAEMYRAMWVQTGVIIGAVVALIKLLP